MRGEKKEQRLHRDLERASVDGSSVYPCEEVQPPINPFPERLKTLNLLKPVDFVFLVAPAPVNSFDRPHTAAPHMSRAS